MPLESRSKILNMPVKVLRREWEARQLYLFSDGQIELVNQAQRKTVLNTRNILSREELSSIELPKMPVSTDLQLVIGAYRRIAFFKTLKLIYIESPNNFNFLIDQIIGLSSKGSDTKKPSVINQGRESLGRFFRDKIRNDSDFTTLYYREGIDKPNRGLHAKFNKHKAQREASYVSRDSQYPGDGNNKSRNPRFKESFMSNDTSIECDVFRELPEEELGGTGDQIAEKELNGTGDQVEEEPKSLDREIKPTEQLEAENPTPSVDK